MKIHHKRSFNNILIEEVDIKSFRNTKYSVQELNDVYNYISDFIKNHSDKENNVYYESVICHKVDRLCLGIPNFILSDEVFKLIKEIFTMIIKLKEDTSIKDEQLKKYINEMYDKFKYLMEWSILNSLL